jgi:hypothetical protein
MRLAKNPPGLQALVRKIGEALENPGVLMHAPSVAHNPLSLNQDTDLRQQTKTRVSSLGKR